MKKTQRMICVSKWFSLILIFLILILLFQIPSSAATSASKHITGLIRYSCSGANLGSYSSTLNSAVSIWNNGINAYAPCCDDNVGLFTGVSDWEVTVSFSSTYGDPTVMGRVSLWAYDDDGNARQINSDTARNWYWAFLYVYPSAVNSRLANSSENYALSDCILKTTVHEFGHILGLGHDGTTVMKQGLSDDYSVSNSNLLDLHNIWCLGLYN